MKNSKILVALFSLSIASIANAEPFDWTACKAETTKYCPAEKDDEKVYACLHDYDSDLSPACDKSQTAYEVKTGKPQ